MRKVKTAIPALMEKYFKRRVKVHGGDLLLLLPFFVRRRPALLPGGRAGRFPSGAPMSETCSSAASSLAAALFFA